MNQQEALKILGLQANAPAEVIAYTASQKQKELQDKINSAPTDALKAKFQQLLDKVNAAKQVLSEGDNKPSANSRSPLSETKMADLPGMVPNGGDAASAQSLQAGTVLAGRYEIKEQIGAGGMGAVYRAADSNTGKDIALKVLLPALLKHERARERFLDEARISQQLSHPNIVNVYDVQQDGDYYFLTMELLEGQDLRQVMDNRKLARSIFAIDEVQEIISAISDGLAYAHKHTVHRDIKPENIWLSEQGEYKVMDFGIARVQSTSQRTQTGAAMGTAYYMAPEQLKGQSDIDGRADQYALAVLAYELLSGEVPAGMIEPIQQHRKDVPKAMANAIHQALSPRPENRFEDIQAFSAAVSAKGGGVNLSALPMKNIGIAAGVIAAIALVVVLGSSSALNNLSDLLPESAEEIAAQKADVAKLIGEIKTYKQRLENGRRQLASEVRDAERNNNKGSDHHNNKEDHHSGEAKALEYWKTLTDNYIFNGSQITDLEGDLSMGESLLRDKDFVQANMALTRVRDGYKDLWNKFNEAESLYVAKELMDKARVRWQKRQQAYGLSEVAEVKAAQSQQTEAKTAERTGDFVATTRALKAAENQWQSAYRAVNEQVAAIDADRQAQAQAERKAAAVKAAAQRKTAAKRAAIAKAQRKKQFIKSFGLVNIPAGRFQMGSNNGSSDEKPIHRVSIKAFKLMSKEVTFAQYDAYAKATGKKMPSDEGWGRGNRPVINVSWQDAKGFAKWLSQQTGKRFRLPTEAEWEYACRSGGKNQTYCGGSSASTQGWHVDNSGKTTHPVGQKQANGLGLYDMSGNVWEWTQDCFKYSYRGAPSNGSAWLGGDCELRVLRGGSWNDEPIYLRSAFRFRTGTSNRDNPIGFRLAQD